MQLLVDFHSHSSASGDSLTTPEKLIRAARQHGLDRLVVTDHNTIAGALACKNLEPDLFIIGEEIKTTCGEILAIYVKQEIPGGLSPNETILRLRDQGAFISVSHPFDYLRSGSWGSDPLSEITSLVDAIEVFNARCMHPSGNHRAREYAKLHHLPGTAGSDAHAGFEVGAARMALPEFRDADELRVVIREGIIQGRLSPFWVHFFSRYAHHRKSVV